MISLRPQPNLPPDTAPAEFVIYDLETTGLSPERCEIIQIAAVRFRGGKVACTETFFSYARPEQPISGFIARYTGVTNAHVSAAPRPHEALERFAAFVGQHAGLIAHNGHRFDSRFVEATCRRHGLGTRGVHSIDSLHLSRRMFGTARGTGHSLDRMLSRLAIGREGAVRHDARGDVALLGRAVEVMWNSLSLDTAWTGLPSHRTCLPV